MFKIYVLFVYVYRKHACFESCSKFYVDIYRYAQNTRVLPVAVGGETLY